MLLCNICLRKLHYRIGFDIVKRYRALLALYSKLGGEFTKDAKQARRVLAAIDGKPSGKSTAPAKAGQGSTTLVKGGARASASASRTMSKLIIKPPAVGSERAPVLKLPSIEPASLPPLPTKVRASLPMKVITPGVVGLGGREGSARRVGSVKRGIVGKKKAAAITNK